MIDYQKLHQLDETSVIPLYVQLAELVRRQIYNGRLAPGDQLPSQREYCDIYGVSDITVSQAMRKLVNEGLLHRKRGKGTFVAEPKLLRDLSSAYSFSKDVERMGLTPSIKILDVSVTAAGDLASDLQLSSPEDRVTRITRLRFADDIPLLFDTTYVPYELAPGLQEEDLTTSCIYVTLVQRHDIQIATVVETIESVILAEEELRLFGCPAECAGFHIDRVASDSMNNPVALTNSITRGDRCRLSISWDPETSSLERRLTLA